MMQMPLFEVVGTSPCHQKPKGKPSSDPRLDELKRMGLPRWFLRAAEELGTDAALAFWRILDGDPGNWHNDTTLRVRLRPYRSYLRFQRNRFIEALAAQGLRPDEIRVRLRRQLGEDVSHRHITRLAKSRDTHDAPGE